MKCSIELTFHEGSIEHFSTAESFLNHPEACPDPAESSLTCMSGSFGSCQPRVQVATVLESRIFFCKANNLPKHLKVHIIIRSMIITLLLTGQLILVEKSIINDAYLEDELVQSSPCLGAVEDSALTNVTHSPEGWHWSLSQHRIGLNWFCLYK